MYVNVAVDTKSRYMDSLFAYEAPDDTKVGDVVRVPFHRNNRERMGYVFETNVALPCDVKQIKSVLGRVEEYSLNAEMMKTIAWMRTRYGIKYIDGVHCFIPPGKPAKPGRQKRPYKDMEPEEQNIEALTDEQSYAVNEIKTAMDQQAADIKTAMDHQAAVVKTATDKSAANPAAEKPAAGQTA